VSQPTPEGIYSPLRKNHFSQEVLKTAIGSVTAAQVKLDLSGLAGLPLRDCIRPEVFQVWMAWLTQYLFYNGFDTNLLAFKTVDQGRWRILNDISDTNILTWSLGLGTETGALSHPSTDTVKYTEGASPVGLQILATPAAGYEIWLRNCKYTTQDITAVNLTMGIANASASVVYSTAGPTGLDDNTKYLHEAWTEDNRLWEILTAQPTWSISHYFSDDLQTQNKTVTLTPEIYYRRSL
jgi:hypothetical protein